MEIELLPHPFTVCKDMPEDAIPRHAPFLFLARTDGELSVVCPTDWAPDGCGAREDGWRAMRIAGCLDFSLIGILAGIADVLTRAGVSIFAVSTYDTDYILVRDDAWTTACQALRDAGHLLREMEN